MLKHKSGKVPLIKLWNNLIFFNLNFIELTFYAIQHKIMFNIKYVLKIIVNLINFIYHQMINFNLQQIDFHLKRAFLKNNKHKVKFFQNENRHFFSIKKYFEEK